MIAENPVLQVSIGEVNVRFFRKTAHLTVDKTCSLLHYPRTKIHIQWGTREDRKPAITEIAGFAFQGPFKPAKDAFASALSHMCSTNPAH
jgi:hypothetical protein